VRLLVTGAAGFIGSAFVRQRLAATSDAIVVLDNLTYAADLARLAACEAEPAQASRLRFVRGDIADSAVVAPLVEDVDGVINFAAESHVDRSILDASAFIRTGVEGVRTLVEAVREVSTRTSRPIRYLQVGTDEVYGSIAEGASREEDPLEPRSPYSAVKAAGDLLALAYHVTHGVDVVVTRGANTFGAYQHPEKLVPLMISNAMDDQPLPVYGDGLQERSWLPVEDHASAIGFVLEHGRSGSIYNVPGSEPRTNLSIVHGVLDRLGRDRSLVRHVADRAGHDRRYSLDGERLRALGWQPSHDPDEALASTVDWYVANEAWWRGHRDADWDTYYARQYGERLASADPAAARR
jgi:dTDP-glucose 4,6-dehydratase